MDLDECVRIAIAVCDALQAAHDHGIVHRDVKPANIVLTAGGIPKLTDFGVARLGADSEMIIAGSAVGTLAYMAPEQEKDAAGASPKSDQYSFEATLYHMLTGESPVRILERRIADVLRDVIVRGTEPDSAQRFPTMADLKLAMCDAIGVSAPSVSAQQTTGNTLDTLKRQKERIHQVHKAARRLAHEQCDWVLARTTLQQIPASVRDQQLWDEICIKADRVSSLETSINKAVGQLQWKGLNLPISELSALQPKRDDLAKMLSELTESDRIDSSALGRMTRGEFRELMQLHPDLVHSAASARLEQIAEYGRAILTRNDKTYTIKDLEILAEWRREAPNEMNAARRNCYHRIISKLVDEHCGKLNWFTCEHWAANLAWLVAPAVALFLVFRLFSPWGVAFVFAMAVHVLVLNMSSWLFYDNAKLLRRRKLREFLLLNHPLNAEQHQPFGE